MTVSWQTIFVNPTQFAPHEDLDEYPRPLEQDLALCNDAGVDVVFTPEVSALYPDGFETFVDVERISTILEGAHRPGHFRGVATIVLKLLNIVQPDIACFGQKDYQQQTLIRRMVRDLDLPVEIVVCPTIREPDGLAMSSRNAYLSHEERKTALSLHRSLLVAEEMITDGESNLKRVRTAMESLLTAAVHVLPEYATIAGSGHLGRTRPAPPPHGGPRCCPGRNHTPDRQPAHRTRLSRHPPPRCHGPRRIIPQPSPPPCVKP